MCDHLRVCARGHNLKNKKISHVLELLNSLVFYESCSDGSGNEASVVGVSNFMDFLQTLKWHVRDGFSCELSQEFFKCAFNSYVKEINYRRTFQRV